jgi:hypothetical protein
MADWRVSKGSKYHGGGAVTASSTGTSVSDNTTVNTKGNWAQIIASTEVEGSGLIVSLSQATQSGDSLIDIAIGAGGSEVVIVENLLFSIVTGSAGGQLYYIPIKIPRGSRISARKQNSVGGTTRGEVLALVVGSQIGSEQPFSRVTTYGADTTDSGGKEVDPGAVAHTKTIVEVAASTTNRIKSLVMAFGQKGSSSLSTATWLVEVMIGAGGSEKVLIPEFALNATATKDTLVPMVVGPLPVDIPAGTRVSIRAQCSITTTPGRQFDVVLYGID